MASDIDFVNYVTDQISGVGEITHKKMFGEYMVYVNQKPIILICDNTPYVKKLDCIKAFLETANVGIPYNGAKEHYILDIDDDETAKNVAAALEKVTAIPKKKAKKAQ